MICPECKDYVGGPLVRNCKTCGGMGYVADPERTYSEIVTVVTPDKAWRYVGCDEHLDWFIAESRKYDDQFVYYRFHCDPDRVTCMWCLAEASGKTKESVLAFNQVSSEVHHP